MLEKVSQAQMLLNPGVRKASSDSREHEYSKKNVLAFRPVAWISIVHPKKKCFWLYMIRPIWLDYFANLFLALLREASNSMYIIILILFVLWKCLSYPLSLNSGVFVKWEADISLIRDLSLLSHVYAGFLRIWWYLIKVFVSWIQIIPTQQQIPHFLMFHHESHRCK